MKSYLLLRVLGTTLCLLAILLLMAKLITVSANGRILSDIIQNILLLGLCLFLIFPEEKRLQNAILIGAYTCVLDFFLETAAVYLAWWFPLGGTQAPPILVVPLEMVLGFFFFGTAIGLIFIVPRKIREFEPGKSGNAFYTKIAKLLKWLFPKKLDLVWLVGFVFLSAVIGMYGDYNAGPGAWVPGPGWQMIYTFFVWFLGGLSMLAVFYTLEKIRIHDKRED
jgi:hypothetical protein